MKSLKSSKPINTIGLFLRVFDENSKLYKVYKNPDGLYELSKYIVDDNGFSSCSKIIKSEMTKDELDMMIAVYNIEEKDIEKIELTILSS